MQMLYRYMAIKYKWLCLGMGIYMGDQRGLGLVPQPVPMEMLEDSVLGYHHTSPFFWIRMKFTCRGGGEGGEQRCDRARGSGRYREGIQEEHSGQEPTAHDRPTDSSSVSPACLPLGKGWSFAGARRGQETKAHLWGGKMLGDSNSNGHPGGVGWTDDS